MPPHAPEHDFLWRTTCRLPERGRIGIFNRSYYEEVLVVRVHPEILRNEGLSAELCDEKVVWEQRYRSIENFETHLHGPSALRGRLEQNLGWCIRCSRTSKSEIQGFFAALRMTASLADTRLRFCRKPSTSGCGRLR
jgi:hypothetical protein